MDSDGLLELVNAVVAVFPTEPRMKIEADLEVTRDANATIERILDGRFLSGSRLDPRRYSGTRGPAQNVAYEVLDSDEDVSPGTGQARPPLPRPRRSGGGRTSYRMESSSDSDEGLIDPRLLLLQ